MNQNQADIQVGKEINAALKRAIGAAPTAPEAPQHLSNNQIIFQFGKMIVAILSTNWEDGASLGETEAARILKTLSPYLTPVEYRLVANGWSEYRHDNNDESLKMATEDVTHRLRSGGQ